MGLVLLECEMPVEGKQEQSPCLPKKPYQVWFFHSKNNLEIFGDSHRAGKQEVECKAFVLLVRPLSLSSTHVVTFQQLKSSKPGSSLRGRLPGAPPGEDTPLSQTLEKLECPAT